MHSCGFSGQKAKESLTFNYGCPSFCGCSKQRFYLRPYFSKCGGESVRFEKGLVIPNGVGEKDAWIIYIVQQLHASTPFGCANAVLVGIENLRELLYGIIPEGHLHYSVHHEILFVLRLRQTFQTNQQHLRRAW